MDRLYSLAVLGLGFFIAGCPPPENESLPMDKVILFERSLQPTAEPTNVATAAAKDTTQPVEESASKAEPRPPGTAAESAEEANSNQAEASQNGASGAAPVDR